jgi:hypothetical protein
MWRGCRQRCRRDIGHEFGMRFTSEAARLDLWSARDESTDRFHAIDNPLLRITGRERGERSPTCASVPPGADRLVSRVVSNPPFS